jgi:tRNA threonylcarbamoyladenosine biosynthesis protein TsaB
MEGLTLLLDSSTPVLFFALAKDQHFLASWQEEMDRAQSEWMIPKLVEFLTAHQLQLHDLNHLIVGVGPGSFTGVRLALTLVKMLASLKPLQVYPLSSLHLAAKEELTIVTLDARAQRRYFGVYQGKEVLHPDQIVNETDLANWQTRYPKAHWVTLNDRFGQPSSMMSLAISIAINHGPISDHHGLKPVYLKDL